MPQRFLKPGYRSSEKVEICSHGARDLYIRIITLVDDFGRYEANAKLLKSEAFPLSDLTSDQVKKWLDELQNSGLAHVFAVDGKDYLQLTNWTERPRQDKSRFPDPPMTTNVVKPTTNPAESCPLSPRLSPVPSSKSSPSLLKLHKVKALGVSEAETESELMDACRQVLGQETASQWGGLWRKRVRSKPGKVKRVLSAMQQDQREGKKIKNPGGYANDLWKRFAD